LARKHIGKLEMDLLYVDKKFIFEKKNYRAIKNVKTIIGHKKYTFYIHDLPIIFKIW